MGGCNCKSLFGRAFMLEHCCIDLDTIPLIHSVYSYNVHYFFDIILSREIPQSL